MAFLLNEKNLNRFCVTQLKKKILDTKAYYPKFFLENVIKLLHAILHLFILHDSINLRREIS